MSVALMLLCVRSFPREKRVTKLRCVWDNRSTHHVTSRRGAGTLNIGPECYGRRCLSTHGINSLFCDDSARQSSARLRAIPHGWNRRTPCRPGTDGGDPKKKGRRSAVPHETAFSVLSVTLRQPFLSYRPIQ